MHMVAHDAETIKLEPKLDLTFLDRKQQYFSTFKSAEAKLSIVTAHGDVIAIFVF